LIQKGDSIGKMEERRRGKKVWRGRGRLMNA
jgi:hypothetical protein